jgi:hypothetical protein
VDRVLKRLIAADLLRLSPGEKPVDDQVEVAHEALVRNWPRLVGWLEDERERIRERLRLTAAAEQWLKLERDPSALLRGALLEDAQRHPDLSELEQEFLQASLDAKAAAEQERELTHRRELEQARALAGEQQRRAESERQWAAYQTLTATKLRQRAWMLGFISVVALALTTLALWLGYVANSQAVSAREQEALAVAARNEAEAQATVAFGARQTAVAQATTADAERATAQAALAEVRAEQTRVRHLENAIDYTAGQLDDLQNNLSTLLGTPAAATATPPALPPATPTPSAQVAATPIAADLAAAPTATALPAVDAIVADPATDAVTVDAATSVILTATEPLMAFVVTDTAALTSTALLTAAVLTDTTGLTSATELTDAVLITPTLIAIVPDIDIALYATANETAAAIETVRAPMRLPVVQATSFWVELLLPDGRRGWAQSWLLTYTGDARQLPLELRYLLVSDEAVSAQPANNLPFTYGRVIALDGAESVILRNDVNDAQSILIDVPVGTDVTLLFTANGLTVDGSNLWYFVQVLDPNGENLVWQGYLPAAAVAPR